MIEIKELADYKDYGRVLSLSNGILEAYVTLDIGPRIIRFGFVGGQNFMRDDRTALGSLTDERFEAYFGAGKAWENLGGHRIWLSPESYPETYYPDLNPVEYTVDGNIISFGPPEETENGIQKYLEIILPEEDASMAVTMGAMNVGNKPQRFALWGLTVCAQDGTEIIPMNTDDTGLLSNRTIEVWPYTNLADPRVKWFNKYVTLTQDPTAETPFKLGFDLKNGEVHYLRNGELFTKSFDTYHPDAIYPDHNCSFETYTNKEFIEIESLSPLCDVIPGGLLELTEVWSLTKIPEGDPTTEEGIDALLNI
ncbi:MAG: hypothetical protein J6C26_10720 [Clostridia bacterium]|nr:hypothetical protein [Clostridia bacterium]